MKTDLNLWIESKPERRAYREGFTLPLDEFLVLLGNEGDAIMNIVGTNDIAQRDILESNVLADLFVVGDVDSARQATASISQNINARKIRLTEGILVNNQRDLVRTLSYAFPQGNSWRKTGAFATKSAKILVIFLFWTATKPSYSARTPMGSLDPQCALITQIPIRLDETLIILYSGTLVLGPESAAINVSLDVTYLLVVNEEFVPVVKDWMYFSRICFSCSLLA